MYMHSCVHACIQPLPARTQQTVNNAYQSVDVNRLARAKVEQTLDTLCAHVPVCVELLRYLVDGQMNVKMFAEECFTCDDKGKHAPTHVCACLRGAGKWLRHTAHDNGGGEQRPFVSVITLDKYVPLDKDLVACQVRHTSCCLTLFADSLRSHAISPVRNEHCARARTLHCTTEAPRNGAFELIELLDLLLVASLVVDNGALLVQ
jgi:hypothetical protein